MPPKKQQSVADLLPVPGKPVQLRKLPTEVIDVKSCIGCVGARNSGKTIVTIDILFRIRDKISTAIVFSESEIVQGTFSSVFPESYVYPKITDESLVRIFNRQEKVTANPPPGVSNTRILLIFDDCASDKKAMRNPNFERLFTLGRHFGIMVIVLVQYLIALPPPCRQNCDYIFCAQELLEDMKVKMFKQFFSIFKKQQLFNSALDFFTKDFGLLVLYTKARTGVLEDTVYWYRASHVVPDFTIGNREYWRLHELYYKGDEAQCFSWDDMRKKVKEAEDGIAGDNLCDVPLFEKLDEVGEPFQIN